MVPVDELNDTGRGAGVAKTFGADPVVNCGPVSRAPHFEAGRG